VKKYFAELKEKQESAVDAEEEPESRNSQDMTEANKCNAGEGERATTDADFTGLLKAGPGKEKRRRIGQEFHGFMDLPLAIRYMIYELLLVKGKVFVPRLEQEGCEDDYFEKDYERNLRYRYLDLKNYSGRRICTSLLYGVSKTVQAEAEIIFWGPGNQFIFPAGEFLAPAGFSGCDPFWTELKPAKDVSYAFDLRDCGYMSPCRIRGDVREDVENYMPGSPDAFENMSQDELLAEIHNKRTRLLEDVWDKR